MMHLSPFEQEILVNSEEEEDQKVHTKEESHTRSVLKGITWRVVATLTTMIVSWFVIQDISSALQIGFIEAILKIGIYYLHERMWAKIAV
jgi:uncharacterized membrane protein